MKSGGVEKHVEELATRLANRGHEVFVYARNNYSDKNIDFYKGVHVIHLSSVPTKHLDTITHTFLATIHALFQGYDVIHFQAIGPSSLSFIARIFQRSAAVVATHHCQDYYHKKWGGFARACLRLGEFIAVIFPHRTIAVSKNLGAYVKTTFKKDATVITNGADVFPVKETGYLQKWNLQKGGYIIYVGPFIRHEGVHYLIEAFKNLEDKHLTRGKKLVIIGDGFHTDDYTRELKDTARGRENIIFTGSLSGAELQQLFSHTYLFVQPSESEGLSMALLEAMGYGRAILASDIKENREPLNDETAVFFRSGSAEDLEEKMVFLINSPALAKDMGEVARKKAQAEYSWDSIVAQTEDLYEDILACKRKIISKQELHEKSV